MTDRISVLTVVLSEPKRTDDVRHIVDAIQMVKGVGRVELAQPEDIQSVLWQTQHGIDAFNAIAEVMKVELLGYKKRD